MKHETIDTFQVVMEFRKKRTNRLRARSLASLKRKTGRPITSIQSQMGAGDEDDDNRVPTVAEMKEMMNAVTAQRPPRTRSTKPENMTNPDGTPKFWFHEDHCWYCDANGHDRQSCDKYKRLLAANGGRRPAGYEGAFEKARKAHRAKHGTGSTSSPSRNTHSSQRPAGPKTGKGGNGSGDKSKKHVKGVTESEGASDDDASDMESSDDDEQTTTCQSLRLQTREFAMRCGEELPNASTNTFAALADPIDEEVAQDLSTWAHKVKIGQTSRKQKVKFHRVRSHHGSMDTIIDSDEKLDQFVERHPQHKAALPTDQEGLEKAEALRPSDDDLGPDEIWCMVDSGAGVHGAKTWHFSRY